MKRPAFQFYPGDWLKDAALRSCSLEARGLWMDMISHMHQAEPYGHLVLNGKPIDEATLARMVGSTPAKVRRLIEELERSGTCARRDDGVLYSRRMVRDEQLRNERAEFGRLGGNPKLLKGKVNPHDKPNPTPSSSSSSSSSTERGTPAFLPEPDWKPNEETVRFRLRLAGRAEAWTAANLQLFIANERKKGASQTQSELTEGFAMWMIREGTFKAGKGQDIPAQPASRKPSCCRCPAESTRKIEGADYCDDHKPVERVGAAKLGSLVPTALVPRAS